LSFPLIGPQEGRPAPHQRSPVRSGTWRADLLSARGQAV